MSRSISQREMFKHEYLKLCKKHGLCLKAYWPRQCGEMSVGNFTEEYRLKIMQDLMYEDDDGCKDEQEGEEASPLPETEEEA